MIWVHFAVVLFFIWLGARMGGIAIGFAGGLGVLVLSLGFGLTPGSIAVDVILIIMAVIAAIATMQRAGGLDLLVTVAERFLRRNPKRVTFLAPVVTYLMTFAAGTGHTAFMTLPVIAEVAKRGGVRPSRPLSIAVVASQIAICASPISAAVVFLASILEPLGVDYVQILQVAIPSTFLAVMVGALVANRMGQELVDDPVYQRRLAAGKVAVPPDRPDDAPLDPVAIRSVVVFGIAILAVVAYATAISPSVGLIDDPPMPRDDAIVTFMLSAATIIALVCHVDATHIVDASTFKSGMSAAICVLGVAWLGTTFVEAHTDEINDAAGDLLADHPWTLAVALFFAATLLYSQAVTTKALMPLALTIGVSPAAAVAAFPAVSALFILPTYPTLLAAVEFDDTGSTRVGKYVFDHPFLLPGTVTIVAAVALGYLIGPLAI